MRLTTDGVIAISVCVLTAVMVVGIASQEFTWWALPFSLLFLTIFAGVLWVCLLNYREDRFRRACEGDYPHEPWMWDKRWRSDHVMSRSRSEFWGSLTFTIILGVFSLFGSGTLLQGFQVENYWVLLNVIPIAGAVYFARSTYLAWRAWRLEQHVTLTFETRPAWIGAKFSTVMTPLNGQQADHIDAWLEHFKIVRREESDGIAFEKVADLKLPGQTTDIGSGLIKISVEIPEKSPATSWSDDEQKRWWDLVIVMGRSDKKITLRYEVPVADPVMHQISNA